MEVKEWPLYFAENLILGNVKSSVGVATLWTPKEAFAKKLNSNTYRIVGQLYSNDGINPMIRNVMANPTIRTVVLCGQDKIGSADSLALLIKNGLNEKGEVIGKTESRVEKEIPRVAVELFRTHVKLIDMRGVLDAGEIQRVLDACDQNVEPWAEPQLFPEAEISADWFPSEGSAYVYRGKTVADVWPKVLHGIFRFGEEKMSHHTSGNQRELWNVVTVITDEDPEQIAWADYFDFTREHFEGYKPQVMTDQSVPSLSYTYGIRLRNHDGTNQVETIIRKLKEEPWSRRAAGVLWNVKLDNDSSHPPCLSFVQATVKYEKLFMVALIRSNDMFRAWPENTLALRTMQKEIADAVNVPMGSLTIVSTSAHIYEESYVRAKEIVDQHYPKLPCEQDPRGNYVITVVPGKEIQITHMNPEGRKIGLLKGTKAMALFTEICSNEGVSVFVHAMDLGAELQKAEIALHLGLEYTQDRPLSFDLNKT